MNRKLHETLSEWQTLKNSLDTGEPWTAEQWNTATSYLNDQYTNNMDHRVENTLSARDPLTPDRCLPPQAQVIQRLGNIQLLVAAGVEPPSILKS